MATALSLSMIPACSEEIATQDPGNVDEAESALTSTRYVFPADAGVIDVTKAPYNAIPNDGIDDTAAIQAAISAAYATRPQTVYFPDGVYNVSDRITAGDSYKRITLQGQSSARAIIRLQNAAPGYTTAGTQKDVISFYNGANLNAVAFRNHIVGLTVDVGAGNPGAVGIRFHASNEGVIRDVLVKSSDPAGLGNSGIRVTRNAPGPLLIKDVKVSGFDAGIVVMFDRFSVTMENIDLERQRVVGIENITNVVSIKALRSVNTVPALRNLTNASAGGGGMVTLIDSTLSGGSAASNAIENAAGSDIFVRNVSTAGYQAALVDSAAGGRVLPVGRVGEYLTNDRIVRLSSTRTTSLALASPATPNGTWAAVSNWAPVAGGAADDTAALQAALSSGKSTVYFPRNTSTYALSGVIDVPSTVTRIIGMENLVSVAPGTVVRVSAASTTPLIIERFEGFPQIDIAANRTVVLRDSFASGAFNSFAGGRLFIENVTGNQWSFGPGLSVYARQLNPEAKAAGDFNIRNYGATLWVLGLKTEGPRTAIDTQNGSTEVLGGFLYPSSGADPVPAFTDIASRVSLRYYNEPSLYPTAVSESATSQLASGALPGFHSGKIMPLYVGH